MIQPRTRPETKLHLPKSLRCAAACRAASLRSRLTVLAIPEWEGRVSPLFDVAGTLVIVHLSAQGVVSCERRTLVSQNPVHRATTLITWRIQKLLCGGISQECQEALESAGLTVIPHLSGCVQGVVRAYLNHQLADPRFSMPGCRARCPCCRTRRYHP